MCIELMAMNRFIYNSYCVVHPGQVQFIPETRAASGMSRPSRNGFKQLAGMVSGRASMALGFAAVVAALMVIAAHVDAERQPAWMALVLIAAAALVLFSMPARRMFTIARDGYRAWVESRQQDAADQRLWNAALQDARLMADLARAMDRQSC